MDLVYIYIYIYIRCEDVGCFHVAQDKVKWRAAVNTVMNLRVPSKVVNVLTS
jgi:hypothetical protein